jgi:amidophosphoribosyltransferase
MVSSAPQIRYPDCYGIDMSKLADFVAFQAAIALRRERGETAILELAHQQVLEELQKPATEQRNVVKDIYAGLSNEDISKKVAEIVVAEEINAEVEIVYQTVENLHQASPEHRGDWYFTGDYPTPGGNKVANRSLLYYLEGVNKRAY